MSLVSTGMTWGSTTTLAELAWWLRDCRRILVLTHVKPDGDAVGSTLAAVRALNASNLFGGGPRAEVWYYGPPPSWLAEVAGATPYTIIDPKQGPPAHADFEAILILDTGSWTQLEPVADWLRKRSDVTAIIDHHVQGDADVALLRVVDTGAAAVCQPVAELCRQVLAAPSLSALPADVATPLFLGLATDTGWFRHSNVDRAVMATAGELIQAGAANVRLYQIVEQQETLSRLRLLSRALNSVELADDGRVAFMTLRKSDFAECRAQPGESGGFVDFTQSIPTVEVTCLLTEASAGEYGASQSGVLTKISLRSKPPRRDGETGVDVNIVAKQLDGGGHIRAAGARIALSIEETKRRVLELIQQQTSSPPSLSGGGAGGGVGSASVVR